VTPAVLDALAFVQITGNFPKGLRTATWLKALRQVTLNGGFRYVLRPDAPDVSKTRLARAHAALLDAGYFYNDLPYRYTKMRGTWGKNRLQYVRGADDPVVTVDRHGHAWADAEPRYAQVYRDGVPTSWATRRAS